MLTHDSAPRGPDGLPVRPTPTLRTTTTGPARPAPAERDRHRLRLVRPLRVSPASPLAVPKTEQMGQPITSATDPRWVLAVRTAEQLQGAVLAPERREKLLRIGRVMGLSPFDANLVIAIVQEQARRGYEPEYCPTAGEPQLRLVPLPQFLDERRRQKLYTWLLLATVLAVEFVAIVLFLR